MGKRIGIVGTGNMGSAILRGIVESNYVRPSELLVYDISKKKLQQLNEEYAGQLRTAQDCLQIANESDIIVLCVKPNFVDEVIQQLRPGLNGKAVVSIAAGWTLDRLEASLAGSGAACMRVMPNTPAMVGEGMTAVCDESSLSEEDFDFAKGIFDAVGKTVVLPEKMFDGATAISGSSPAYVYMMIEAMADAGVREGIPRKKAYEMAAQAVLGSALMVLSTGSHPGELKDAVCSPAGTTIEAVEVLEKKGFRSAIMEAMRACADKSREMSAK